MQTSLPVNTWHGHCRSSSTLYIAPSVFRKKKLCCLPVFSKMKLTAWPGAALTNSCWLPLTRRMSFYSWLEIWSSWASPSLQTTPSALHSSCFNGVCPPCTRFHLQAIRVCGSLFFCHLWEGGAHCNGAPCAAVALETVHGSFNVYPYFAATGFPIFTPG